MRRDSANGILPDNDNLSPSWESTSIVIATILRETGNTGVHTHVRQLLGYLDRKGMSASLVTPFSWRGPVIGPVFGLRLLLDPCSGVASVWWYRHWHEVFLYRALRRQLASGHGCVIYAQCPLAARAALRARRGPQQRIVTAVHFRVSQADEWVDKGYIGRDGVLFRRIRSLEREVLPRVDGIVYVSQWGRDALLDWLPHAAAVPSTVIRNFVAPHELRRSAPIADLVSVGSLEAVKNHLYLLEILAEAKAAGRVYTLDVFGEGPLQQELHNRIRALGLEGQVRLRGFRSDVRDFLSGYRAYVHTSYSESLPLAIIEAMAAGLPVLAADTGGVAELVQEGVEGFFWPLDDASCAASVLMSLMDDEVRRGATASAAFRRFQKDFDADVSAPRLLSFITGAQPPPGAARQEHLPPQFSG